MNPQRRSVIFGFLIAAAALTTIASGALANDGDGEFNERGNYLIADQFNNRVIEVAPSGKIVWQFGLGPSDFSPASIIGTNDAQRVGEFTLMAGTGTPPNQPEAPNCKNSAGCLDNRVLLVDRDGHIVWHYGQFGVAGAGPDQLSTPVQNTWVPVDEEQENNKASRNGRRIPQGHVLITDQGNGRIIQVRVSDKQIVWEYDGLNNPNCAELLKNGHILICDENNNQALEVTHTKPSTIVHTYTIAGGMLFSGVAFASRLPNGHTLITDSNNARIVETNENGTLFWQYFTNTDPKSNPRCINGTCTGPLPTRALRLHNGNTLISDQYNHRVIEVSPDLQIVRTFGRIASLGYNTKSVEDGGLNSPYDAKRIGDYTGITSPLTPPQDPSIATTSLPNGTIGSSYSQTIQATGGVAPFTWSVTSGALPHSVALPPGSTDNSVTISGTPDRVQASVAFTIQVTDANSQSAKQPYTVSIKSTPTIAVTQSGAAQGVVEGNFLRFRGIPFAAPPVGPLRWKPPVAPKSWDGIRSAANFGNRCPQTDFVGGVQGDEDCLTLNVYTTNPPVSSKQPVMVFFHGGGELLGSAQDPPWDLVPPLAGHGVIVVTAQYRLGLLGFLANPLLTAESGTGSSGNYGLMDMIAALQWVHDNIAEFNGDPTRVMMFGQSAGSLNVQALLASPKAVGLFTSAGMESSVLTGNLLGTGVADAYPIYANLAKLVQCDTTPDVLMCLRAVSANTMVLTELLPNEFGFIGFNLEPIVLPEDPFNKLKQFGSPVPLLIGSNRDEAADLEDPSVALNATDYATAIHAQFDPLLPGTGTTTGDKLLSSSYYPAAFDTTPRYTHIDIQTDYFTTWETRNLARAVAPVAGAERPAVWRYLFTHQYETDSHLTIRRAFHTAELYFVAGLVPGSTRSVYYDGTQYTPNAAEGALSNEIMDYWARFAATGDPNGGGAVQWLPYDVAENILLLDDTIANLPAGYRNTQCDFLETLPQP